MSRDRTSVIGRINIHQKELEVAGRTAYPQRFKKREQRFFMPEERKELRRKVREERKKKKLEVQNQSDSFSHFQFDKLRVCQVKQQ